MFRKWKRWFIIFSKIQPEDFIVILTSGIIVITTQKQIHDDRGTPFNEYLHWVGPE